MKSIRVLVVDDSAFVREWLVSILSLVDEISVIGEATNGQEAIDKVHALRPDLVTMDIEMPVMDGLEAIEQIMASMPVPILVVTVRGDSHTAFEALSRGALELVDKADINSDTAEEFIRKVKLLSEIKVIKHIRGIQHFTATKETQRPLGESGPDKVIAIASSTGGPAALSRIVSELPENLPCPLVIAQHIADGFVSGMVDWLNGTSSLNIVEGREGEEIIPANVYIAPSEKHMQITSANEITLTEKGPGDIYTPSCDILLSSVASVYGSGAVGIILTGMGDDGASGIGKIKEAGGVTIAQDEESSAVFGMPKVAIENGCIDRIITLDDISQEIQRLFGFKP